MDCRSCCAAIVVGCLEIVEVDCLGTENQDKLVLVLKSILVVPFGVFVVKTNLCSLQEWLSMMTQDRIEVVAHSLELLSLLVFVHQSNPMTVRSQTK